MDTLCNTGVLANHLSLFLDTKDVFCLRITAQLYNHSRAHSHTPNVPFRYVYLSSASAWNAMCVPFVGSTILSLETKPCLYMAKGLKRFADVFKHNHMLTELNICQSNLLSKSSGQALASLLHGNTTLTALYLCQNGYDEEEEEAEDGNDTRLFMQALAPGLQNSQSLKILDMRCIEIDSDAVKELADALVGNSVLMNLNMPENFICTRATDQNVDVSGVSAISNTFSTLHALTKWNISDNCITAEGTQALAKSLECNSVLQELDMSSNKLTVNQFDVYDLSGVRAIRDVIPTMESLTKMDISNNDMGAEAVKIMAEAWMDNGTITELDLFSICAGCSGVQNGTAADTSGISALVNAIPTMRALVSVNLLYNKIDTEQAQTLAALLETHSTLKSLCGNKGGETVLNMSGYNLGADGTIMLASEIVVNGVLEKLFMGNTMYGAEAGMAMGRALALSTGLTELDLSDLSKHEWSSRARRDNPTIFAKRVFAKRIANGLSANKALTSVNILNNNIGTEQANELIAIMASKSSLKTLCGFIGDETELDLSKKRLSAGCAVLVANEVKNSRSLVSANLLDNNLDIAHAQHLATILKEHETLKSLCGNKGDETELNMNGKNLGADGAIMLAPEMIANLVLVKCNLSRNKLGDYGTMTIAEALKGNHTLTELNLSQNFIETLGALEMAKAIPTMSALTNLNMSKNGIGRHMVLPEGWTVKNRISGDMVIYCHTDGREQYEHPGEPKAARAIADAIIAHGSLKTFDVSDNELDSDGWHIIAEVLKNNTTLTEMNTSCNERPYFHDPYDE